MSDIPEKMRDLLSVFSLMTDRSERVAALIDLADEFAPVPAAIATAPYPDASRAPNCESDAYVFAREQNDNTLRFYFAVENPQGVSAMAMAAIMDQTLSEAPLEQVLAVDADVIYAFFGRELSMGKSAGLMGMVQLVHALTKRHLVRPVGAPASSGQPR